MKNFALLVSFLFAIPLFSQEGEFARFESLRINNETDSVILTELYDTLLLYYGEDENQSIEPGSVHYPPDSSFRIYTFSGEGCGAYCNPFWEMFWAWEDEKTNRLRFEVAYDLGVDIDSIVKLNENQYLLLGHSHGRPRGIEGAGCKSALLLSFKDSLTHSWEFEVCTSNLASENKWICDLEFDALLKTISYQYQWYDEYPEFKSYLVAGELKYEKGVFIEMKSTKTYNP